MERSGATAAGGVRAVLAGLVIACLPAVLGACSSSVSGAPTGGDRPAPTSATSTPDPTEESTEESTEEPTGEGTEESTEEGTAIPAPPTSIDQTADQQYCEPFIIGPGNQRMQVVVVATPGGRVNCDQAAAVLVDYYAERPTPDPASEPIVVAGNACDQVPVPDIPQVICTDGASLFYSMWVQGG
jgi:hypothetical protein